MTPPTKEIYKLLLNDYVKKNYAKPKDLLFKEIDLHNSLEKIKLIKYQEVFFIRKLNIKE